MVRWLKIFFENLLGRTDGLNSHFLIAHCIELHAIEPAFQLGFADIVPTIVRRGRSKRLGGRGCGEVGGQISQTPEPPSEDLPSLRRPKSLGATPAFRKRNEGPSQMVIV